MELQLLEMTLQVQEGHKVRQLALQQAAKMDFLALPEVERRVQEEAKLLAPLQGEVVDEMQAPQSFQLVEKLQTEEEAGLRQQGRLEV